MASASDGTDVPVLLTALFLTSKEQDTVPSTMEGENQRNVRTSCEVAAAHAERIQIRKLRPDAFP